MESFFCDRLQYACISFFGIRNVGDLWNMNAIFSLLENRIVYCTKFVINLAGTILCGLPVALLDIYAIFSDEIVRNFML